MTIYFVLHGLHNGEKDVRAVTTDGTAQRDGWYYLPVGADNGIGPFCSCEDARQALRRGWEK